MKLCDNCLDPITVGRGSFPMGPDRGPQRDPYRASVDLCLPCQNTLGGHLGGDELPVDLAAFHARWVTAREVQRGPP